MEYKVFKIISKIPKSVRMVLGVISLAFGLLATLPIIPGAVPGIVIGLLLLVRANKIKKVVKIRKGLIFLFQDFSKKKMQLKWRDFKRHLRHMFYHKK